MCGGGAARDGAWNLGAPRERGRDPGAHQGRGVFPQSQDSEEEMDPGKGRGHPGCWSGPRVPCLRTTATSVSSVSPGGCPPTPSLWGWILAGLTAVFGLEVWPV